MDNLERAAGALVPLCVAEGFETEGRIVKLSPLGEGHINRTYKVTCALADGGTKKYVFQRINTKIFRKPVELMDNVVRVTEHIRSKAAAEGRDPERSTLRFVPARAGGYLVIDEQGEYWRAYVFIDDCVVYQQVEKTEDFYKAGVALGRFQQMLADFPADELDETIPNFHNTVSRFADFQRIVSADPVRRLESCIDEVRFVQAREDYCGRVLRRIDSGEVPVRVTHNDTKLNNVLMDKATGEVLCLIDLDTVMPGSALYDFGDSIRFGASSAAEDEPDLSKVHFVPELYDAYREGYLSEVGGVLTTAELELLPFSAILMTYECGMRFLGDYIDGDNYFAVARPAHNLDRARTQFWLVAEMEQYFGIH